MPPMPVTKRAAISHGRLGESAAPNEPTAPRPMPSSNRGFLPYLSEKGPENTAEKAQGSAVTVASCPTTATEESNSSAKSTSKGPSMVVTVMLRNNDTTAKGRSKECSV